MHLLDKGEVGGWEGGWEGGREGGRREERVGTLLFLLDLTLPGLYY